RARSWMGWSGRCSDRRSRSRGRRAWSAGRPPPPARPGSCASRCALAVVVLTYRPTRLACLAHERAQIRHLALGDLAHDLAHLLELLDQLLDRVDVGARALGDAQPARALDQ